MSEHTFDIIDYVFMGIAVAIFIGSLFMAGYETKNEWDYFDSLLKKVADGTIEKDEYEYLLRKLTRG